MLNHLEAELHLATICVANVSTDHGRQGRRPGTLVWIHCSNDFFYIGKPPLETLVRAKPPGQKPLV
jgi:hypothetical protein